MKANKSEHHSTILEHITRIVLSLREQRKDVDTDYVANVVEARIDVHQVSPHLTKYLALLQLKQDIRGYLRTNLDPVKVAAAQTESGQDDLFGSILQDYYPAKRTILGEEKSVYIPIETMTAEDVDMCASKMEKTSEKLARHAEALRADFAMRNDNA